MCLGFSENEPKSKRRKVGKVKQTENSLDESQLKEDEKLLSNYFRLDVSLDEMYETWSQKDPNFKEIAMKFYGVRMLRQDPAENIFSFICSSNNNISRYLCSIEVPPTKPICF